MAGYSRQSAASIVPTAVVRATPLNDEFNALRDAFVTATGHKHDGTATEGAYIPLISDTNARNKVVVDSVNNRLSLFVNVGGTTAEQLRVIDGALIPVLDNDIDLGSSTFEFKDLFIDGTANIDSLIADTAAISAGTINNTLIGNTAPQTVVGTTITATVGFFGSLTGNVTGNVTGNLTGNVLGNVTGTLFGNVTATTGTSTFNNVTINGTLDMNAGSAGTITNLPSPTNASDAATKGYVDTAIANVIDSAPAALDTLNELAAALGDDANFATNVTNSIAGKVSKAGDSMTGALAMGNNKITGLGTPTANTDAATKGYVDTQRDTRLALSGGTMTGAIAMSTNKITDVGDPTAAQDAATKNYIDTLFGSTVSAAASAAAAAVSAGNAATSASNAASSATSASNSATSASNSASAAAASYDAFDDRYLGSKASPPSVDNDGNALLTGALYFDTTANEMRVWTGSTWKATGSAVNGTAQRQVYTATASQTTFAIVYDVGFVDVYRNGVKQVSGVDFTATSGTNIVFSSGLTAGDIVDIIAYGAFSVANTYTQAQSDSRFLQLTGGTLTGAVTFSGGQTFAASGITGTLSVANGGTGNTSYTNGQLLIGNSTGNTLTKSTLTAGTGILITNGPGSITIAAAASDNSLLYYFMS